MAANSQNCISRLGTLSSGQSLTSHNGQNVLTMQTDGNLVCYQGGSLTYDSNTPGNGNYLSMLQDGSLIIYSASGNIVATLAGPNNGVFFIVQDDGSICEYTQGNPIFCLTLA